MSKQISITDSTSLYKISMEHMSAKILQWLKISIQQAKCKTLQHCGNSRNSWTIKIIHDSSLPKTGVFHRTHTCHLLGETDLVRVEVFANKNNNRIRLIWTQYPCSSRVTGFGSQSEYQTNMVSHVIWFREPTY